MAPLPARINLALGIASLGAQFVAVPWPEPVVARYRFRQLVIGSARVLIALCQRAAERREYSGRR